MTTLDPLEQELTDQGHTIIHKGKDHTLQDLNQLTIHQPLHIYTWKNTPHTRRTRLQSRPQRPHKHPTNRTNNKRIHMNPYTKPNPEQDKIIKALTQILKEDGHNTQHEGHGNTATITITTKNHTTWTITLENDKIHLHPANIQTLTSEYHKNTQFELANPNCFTQIKNHINNHTPKKKRNTKKGNKNPPRVQKSEPCSQKFKKKKRGKAEGRPRKGSRRSRKAHGAPSCPSTLPEAHTQGRYKGKARKAYASEI